MWTFYTRYSHLMTIRIWSLCGETYFWGHLWPLGMPPIIIQKRHCLTSTFVNRGLLNIPQPLLHGLRWIPLRFCRYCQSVVVLCWKLCLAARYVCVSVKRTWSLGSAAKRRLGWVGRVHQWSKISFTDHPWFSRPGHPQRLNHASWFSSGAAMHFYIWRYFYVWMLR